MPITTHPNQNAMTRTMRARLSHTIAQLELAAQIQKSPTYRAIGTCKAD